MGKKLDLTGQRFGRLVAIGCVDRLGWRCLCECGHEVVTKTDCLRRGYTRSCGCLRSATAAKRATVHGLSGTSIHVAWKAMRARCLYPSGARWKHYGGRGISVCDEWGTFKPFYDWSMANGWQPGLQIDRIDNDGNYEPGNCRWATRTEQANNRSATVMLSAFGEVKSMAEWLSDSRCLVCRGTLYSRLRCGWDTEEAMSAQPSNRTHRANSAYTR